MFTPPYATMAYLAVELIIFGILARLTPKDVVKCKSVCREWRAMLSTQEFERAHFSHSLLPSSQRTLFIRESNCSIYPMDFETGDYGPPTIIQFPLHVGLKAHIYSRNLGTWRKIPFQTKPRFVHQTFYWSPGTLCGDTLYFTVCECWVVGRNLLIAFDTTTEQLKEISFPPVPPAGIFHGVLANVRDFLQMVLTTGMQEMSLGIWALQGDHWVILFLAPPIPPVSLSLWLSITHYMTNGRWFVMAGQRKVYEIPLENKQLERFYPEDVIRLYLSEDEIEWDMSSHHYANSPFHVPVLCGEVIVFEILTRIPAKDVGCSKSVCKEWYALLSTQDFERAHSSRSSIPANQKTLIIRELNCDSVDFIGFYKDPMNDYNVMHVRRGSVTFEAHIYSRQAASWRKIPFHVNVEYLKRSYSWSTGTQCGETVYYTVSDPGYECKNVVVAFNTVSEQAKELTFPPVKCVGAFITNFVNVRGNLHMIVTTGLHAITLELWELRGEKWVNAYSNPPIPPIPIPLWCSITHYMTNGKWFVMSDSRKLFEIPSNMERLECRYSVSYFHDQVGAVFLETVVSPAI
ncbi:hypothetical protein L1987_13955 [Smallanthus sonchifolius]|uniref:Uncharacterized protein n=1 Tax=Smallanthus sonchifolius TaxID=185202 RepID=A0ACB9JIZ5_9ASTR|nr:hypothetical protein L1987_13955 [Smallanthus sonchifolius]